MMRGLVIKSVRETWVATLLYGVGMLFIMAGLTAIVPQVQGGFEEMWNQIPFVRTILAAFFGIGSDDAMTGRLLQAALLGHPMVLALVWAHGVQVCTRYPVGEIDRGTIDVLLGLPVSRRSVYFSETCVWLIGVFVIVVLGGVGHIVTGLSVPPEGGGLGLEEQLQILLMLYCNGLAIGGLAFLASAVSDRVGVRSRLCLWCSCFRFLLTLWRRSGRRLRRWGMSVF